VLVKCHVLRNFIIKIWFFIVYSQNLDRGDVIVGVISALHEVGLTVMLLALDGDMARDIADLKLTVRSS
jgi:hypothetical protein